MDSKHWNFVSFKDHYEHDFWGLEFKWNTLQFCPTTWHPLHNCSHYLNSTFEIIACEYLICFIITVTDITANYSSYDFSQKCVLKWRTLGRKSLEEVNDLNFWTILKMAGNLLPRVYKNRCQTYYKIL